VETRTAGAAGGSGKRAGRKASTAPIRPDPAANERGSSFLRARDLGEVPGWCMAPVLRYRAPDLVLFTLAWKCPPAREVPPRVVVGTSPAPGCLPVDDDRPENVRALDQKSGGHGRLHGTSSIGSYRHPYKRRLSSLGRDDQRPNHPASAVTSDRHSSAHAPPSATQTHRQPLFVFVDEASRRGLLLNPRRRDHSCCNAPLGSHRTSFSFAEPAGIGSSRSGPRHQPQGRHGMWVGCGSPCRGAMGHSVIGTHLRARHRRRRRWACRPLAQLGRDRLAVTGTAVPCPTPWCRPTA
jgi:hypothetical protein